MLDAQQVTSPLVLLDKPKESPLPTAPQAHAEQPKLSWKDGLFLVGPDPLTSLFYSSGALIVAGVGYATPAFQIGLYLLLFLLAPLYIEAVLLTLSNGGTYVMTRYALSRFGRWATVAAAVVGVVISFSYVATAIVSLLSYSDYLMSLFDAFPAQVPISILASAVPAIGFGVWVMPKQWRTTVILVGVTTVCALALSTIFPAHVVVMLAPLVLLFRLNNYGLRESVKVSKTIFLVNLLVMAVTILASVVYLFMHGAHLEHFMQGVELPPEPSVLEPSGIRVLPGFATLGFALLPAALGSSILGASGVESVMNIPEELADPRRGVRRIYRWMLSILLLIGGSTAILLFLVLEPAQLVGESGYLIATLGNTAFAGVSGLPWLGRVWKLVIVVNAALMLLAATNTGFAGARGLWVTMARDSLLPRFVLATNERGSYERVHWMMLIAILLLCGQAGAESSVLERWYGASFGLVMFSGVVAFILLRKYKGDDRRLYTAKPNFQFGGVSMPYSAVIGLAFLSMALLGLYDQYAEQIGALQGLLLSMAAGVGVVLLAYNHRPLLRAAHHYFQRVVETVEEAELETGDDTVVVAVGGARIGRLIRRAVQKAEAYGKSQGRTFRRLVVFHMTTAVTAEHVYRVTADSIRPSGLPNDTVRIFTELTQLVTPDMTTYLVLAPNPAPGAPGLLAAMDALVAFHDRHEFEGNLFMIGDYGVRAEEKKALAARLEGSTLLAVPV